MKIGWVCDTAYQVLNCMAYVLNHSNQTDTFDLYIGHQFVNSEVIEKKLRETGLFCRIIPYKPLGNEKGAAGVAKKVRGVISPRYRIERMLINSDDIKQIPDKYDKVFVSVLAYFHISLVFFTDAAQVIYFDDGLGTYFRDLSDLRTKTKVIYALLGHNLKKLKPAALYLNNPALCKNSMQCPKYPLPRITADDFSMMNMLSQIFDYKRDGYYSEFRIIYLTQPKDDAIAHMDEEVDSKIRKLVRECKENTLIRPHPRQRQVNTEGLALDDHRDMWELVCADQIHDEHVLIGIFSTAQITPKLFYNKEPYIIFLYNLYPMLNRSLNRTEIMNLIETMKNTYSKPEKVLLPNTLEELEACIRQIVGGVREEK